MKVDLSQLKIEVEEELKALDERKAVLAKSLEQIRAVEMLVAHRRDGDERITLTRFPHYEKSLNEGEEGSKASSGKTSSSKAPAADDEEPQVRIEWIQAG